MKKSGFVTIIGRPNVGKSTILNSIIGEKIAIVSPRPQTTRNSITGILNTDDAQMIFLDTPGYHKSRSKLGEYMVNQINDSLVSTDVILFVCEPLLEVREIEKEMLANYVGKKVILVINKIDTTNSSELAKSITAYSQAFDFTAVVPISALKDSDVSIVISEVLKLLPEGPMYFPEDMITDQPEKVIMAEILREKALRLLSDEVPHGIAIVIERYKERENSDIIDIDATIFCEKDSHKGIIIGKNGDTLKKIASNARFEMERFLDCKINLKCWVKVKSDWRNNEFMLRNFGFGR
ncbi:MAG: GTPase Era [Clostridia bacterium]